MDYISLGYIGIFIAAFIASTILPAPSEIIIVLAFQANFNTTAVIIIATIGNVLGSLTNYYLGYISNSKKLISRFNLNENKINYWTKKTKKYGYWLGLLAWIPIIGDPLMALIGFLKVNIKPLILTITIGKLVRYIVVASVYFYNLN